MKPFNLKEALEGKAVVTRDGRKVKIAGYNPDADKNYKLVGWLSDTVEGWSDSGVYLEGDSDEDLFMAPEKKEYWIGLFRKDGFVYHYINDNAKDLNEVAAADLADVLVIKKIYEEEI